MLSAREAEHDVVEACTPACTPATLLASLVPVLRAALDADAAVVSATDPDTTVVASAAVVDNLPASLCAPWFHNEFLEQDVNRFADLHRCGGPPATIHGATRGEPQASPRFRDLYGPLGLGPEVRTTLSAHGACWGVVSLVRAADKPDFAAAEIAWLDRVRAPMTHALRQVVVAPSVADASDGTPGIVTLTPEGRVVSMSTTAAELLAELDGPRVDTEGVHLPGQAYVVATAVRARALHGSRVRPVTRVRGRSGRWLTVRGDHTSSPAGELVNIVLVVEPAHPAELMPLLVAAYDLTAREQEVLSQLATGHATGEIADRLFISEHTVRDHVKSLLAKTGTGSRGELLSLLLHRHALPGTEVVHH